MIAIPGLRELAGHGEWKFVAALILRGFDCDWERAESNWKETVRHYRQRNVQPMSLAVEKAAKTWASELQKQPPDRDPCHNEDQLVENERAGEKP